MGHLDGEVAHVYCMLNGTVTAVDQTFVDWFGMSVDDCVGTHLAGAAREADEVRTLFDQFNELKAAGSEKEKEERNKRIEAGECRLQQVRGGLVGAPCQQGCGHMHACWRSSAFAQPYSMRQAAGAALKDSWWRLVGARAMH